MSIELVSILLIVGFVLLMFSGVEVAIALGLISIAGLVFLMNQSIDQIAITAWFKWNSFTFTVLPLFVFMGLLFANTGVVRTLFNGLAKLVGFIPGGLASATIVSCGVFGALCGSSISASATFSGVAYPELARRGYEPRLTLGIIAVGGSLSTLIPPGLALIVYGAYQGVSIIHIFAGAIIPGAILTFLFMMTVIVLVKLNPSLSPVETKYTWRQRLSGIVDVAPWIGLIVLILGAMLSGILSVVEGGALGSFSAILLTLAYRRFTYAALKQSLLTTIRITSMILFIIAMASVFSHVFHFLGTIDALTSFIVDLPWGTYALLAVIYIIFIILGCFMEGLALIVILLPFITPILNHMGLSLVWFGVIWGILNETGLVTPPYGVNLFVIHGMLPQHSIFTIARGVLPFFPCYVITLILCTAFPQLVLWLPSLML